MSKISDRAAGALTTVSTASPAPAAGPAPLSPLAAAGQRKRHPGTARRALGALAVSLIVASCGGGSTPAPAPATPPASLAAPSIGNAMDQNLTKDTALAAPIAFANTGGAAAGCAVNPNLPDGLSVGRSTAGTASCQITGTPTATAAQATYTITATNATGNDTATVVITVIEAGALAAPSLANASVQNLTKDTALASPVEFANSGGGSLFAINAMPTPGCQVSPALPDGLDLDLTADDSSCQITGTPTATAAQATYTITATNATGANMATVVITVIEAGGLAAPVLVNATAQILTAGTALDMPVEFDNSGGGTLFEVGATPTSGCASSPGLPLGLVLERTADGNSCQINGTPTTATAQNTYMVTAANATGTGTAEVSIVVNPRAPVLVNAAAQNLTKDTALAMPIEFDNTGGGSLFLIDATPTPGCAVLPALPSGLVLALTDDGDSCQISGTPDAAAAQDTYTVTAANITGRDTATVAISIADPNAANPIIPPATQLELAAGLDGGAFVLPNAGAPVTACSIDTSGGNPDLPAGLDISPNTTVSPASCQITGTPASATTAAVTVTIVAMSASGSITVTATITVITLVAPDLANGIPQILTAGLAVSRPVNFENSGGGRLLAINAIPDPGCEASPALPEGLVLGLTDDGDSCQITGTPDEAAAQTTYTVTARNPVGMATGEVSIVVNPRAPALANAVAAIATENAVLAMPIVFANSGGSVQEAGGCAAVPVGGLPGGLGVERVAQENGVFTCQITGTPTVAAARATYTVRGANITGSITANVDITINPAAPDLTAPAAQILTVGVALADPLEFTNDGGGGLLAINAMPDPGCEASPALPAGLMLGLTASGDSCQITGTPEQPAAQASYTVTATNAGGFSTATIDITVNPAAPDLANAAAVIATQNIPITSVIFANSGGSVRETGGCETVPANSLPSGLELDRVAQENGIYTCRISGDPDTVATVVTVTVRGSNITGMNDATVDITVNAPVAATEAPALDDIGPAAEMIVSGQPVDIIFTNTGGNVASGGCAVAGTSLALPNGLMPGNVTDSGKTTCRISGSTTELIPAPGRLITIEASNNANGGSTDTASVTIVVNPPAPDLMAAAAQVLTVDTAPSPPIEFTNNGGGMLLDINALLNPGCAVDTELPDGLELALTVDGDSCRITGAPTEVSALTTYMVTATNAGGPSTAAIDITVNPAAPALVDLASQSLTFNDPLATPIKFTNNGGGSLFALGPPTPGCQIDRTLPLGLRLGLTDDGSSCQITGTPTMTVAALIYNVTATNAGGNSSAAVSIAVTEALDAPVLTSPGDQVLIVDTAIATPIEFDNSGGGMLFAIGASTPGCEVSPDLPEGLVLGLTANDASCQITGTPTMAGEPDTYTVTATNATGAATADVVIVVSPPAPDLAGLEASITVVLGVELDFTFVNEGGGELLADDASPEPGCAIEPALPNGLVLARSDDESTCQITGTPLAAPEAGIHTVTATNHAGPASVEFEFRFASSPLAAALDSSLDFTFSGNADWGVQTAGGAVEGGSYASSGNINDFQESCIATQVSRPGRLSFYWRVSSEEFFDFLRFYINGSQISQISGEQPWAEIVRLVQPSANPVELRWCYEKDGSASRGVDTGHLDNVVFESYPYDVLARAVSATEIGLDWAVFPGAAYYRVYRATAADPGTVTELTTAQTQVTTSFIDSTVAVGTNYLYWIEACDAEGCSDRSPATAIAFTDNTVDADGDGLIEISSLEQLNNVRYSLSGEAYFDGPAAASAIGCPAGGCFGYELAAGLDFDIGGDGATWIDNLDGTFTLDSDDDALWFDSANGGWLPIGAGRRQPFDAVFEGNGFTIANLAVLADLNRLGLFGYLGPRAQIRNLGVIDGLAAYAGDRTITLSAGVLAAVSEGDITASYATGIAAAAGGSFDRVGVLVGRQTGGDIHASFSAGAADGGAGVSDTVGGLIGLANGNASITASYSAAAASGGTSGEDRAGGLVGQLEGGVTACYATGIADGGSGYLDSTAPLVGYAVNSGITDSWGFGAAIMGGGLTVSGEDLTRGELPPSVTTPDGLTKDNVPDTWKTAENNALGLWSFAEGATPAINYADYDGETVKDTNMIVISGELYHCASDAASAPDGTTLIAGCTDSSTPLIANQRQPLPVTDLDLESASSTANSLTWSATLNTTRYEIYRGTSPDAIPDTELAEVAASNMATATYEDDNLTAGVRYYYWALSCNDSGCADFGEPLFFADEDGDGLIEIRSLADLDSVRRSPDGDRYRRLSRGGGMGVDSGCPDDGCIGFELVADLDFDTSADADTTTWTDNGDGSYTLDADDDAPWFDASAGGWLPIAASEDAPFNAVFEGNGRTISNLAVSRDIPANSLFGYLGSSGQIRNLGLVDALANCTGFCTDDDFSSTYTGVLVGLSEGDIIASYATGAASGGISTFRYTGGLIGRINAGSVHASFADVDVDARLAGSNAFAGGLVGWQSGGSITASYAHGSVIGSGGGSDDLGGLVGSHSIGSITACYATGLVDGGGGNDSVGALVGSSQGTSAITDSYGFGAAINGGGTAGFDGSALDANVTTAADLTATNAGATWMGAANETENLWNFGTSAQTPAIRYADYDGSEMAYHCAADDSPPADAALIAECEGSTRPLIANQRRPFVVAGITLEAVAGPANRLTWPATLNTTRYEIYRGTTPDARPDTRLAEVADSAMATTTYDDDDLTAGVTYYYWVLSCNADHGCADSGEPVFFVDEDGNGLIEIRSLADLDRIRHSLSGDRYRSVAGAAGTNGGCPADGCIGFELTESLDFNIDDDDTTTWTDNGDGTYTLDAGDDAGWFDVSGGGWLPIGASEAASFNAVFEGNGFTISNLAVSRNIDGIGLFGYLGAESQLRNLGLINTLAEHTGSANAASTGALAGISYGAITASYATGAAVDGGGGDLVETGGLVGRQRGGSIHASFTSGEVRAGSGATARAGGLVGVTTGGSVSACYSTAGVLGLGGASDAAGGLIGAIAQDDGSTTVTASYAAGAVDGGAGNDNIGALVGQVFVGDITDSYGFGATTNGGGTAGSAGSALPANVTTAVDLIAGNVEDTWKTAANSAENLWDFGTASQTPAIQYADYDGSGMMAYHCAADASPPMDAVLIAECAGSTRPLIANQRRPFAVAGITLEAVAGPANKLTWPAAPNTARYEIYRATTPDTRPDTRLAEVAASTMATATYDDDDITAGVRYYYWVLSCNDDHGCLDSGEPAFFVDEDSDGLIEIRSLADLDNIRHSLSGDRYRQAAGDAGADGGCPETGCVGFELVAHLDFDTVADADTFTWVGAGTGTYTLDRGDDAPWFDVENGGGWLPIGDETTPFNAVFEGNGYTITNLAVSRSLADIGMFGYLGADSQVRNLGLVDALADHNSSISTRRVGLLAGSSEGDIIASYAIGSASCGISSFDRVGGLVGVLSAGAIHASYADVDIISSSGSSVRAGGFVGLQTGGSITASYATGAANGTNNGDDDGGGLVGLQTGGSITASYATVSIDGRSGNDNLGALVGRQANSPAITHSYGFGALTNGGGTAGTAGSGLPSGVTTAADLTATNAEATWTGAANSAENLWDFGSASQTPAINYADYDGSEMAYHCAAVASPPADAVLIARCTDPLTLIPNQRPPEPVSDLAIEVVSETANTLTWTAVADATRYEVWRGTVPDAAMATELTTAGMSFRMTTFEDTGLAAGAIYYYWARSCGKGGCAAFGDPFYIVDADGDGLIEIRSLADLHNIRHSLSGDGYRFADGASPIIGGCPETGCIGFELAAGLDFDGDDDDDTAWTESSGTFTLDSDDDADWFDVSAGGWLPIGASEAEPFDAVFEGNGYTISNLAASRDLTDIGLFGHLGADSEVRNLGIVDAYVNYTGSSPTIHVGALAGRGKGYVVSSYATGFVRGGGGEFDRAGGLIGLISEGLVHASYADADINAEEGGDRSGGLVGVQTGGAIVACHARGPIVEPAGGADDDAGGLVGLQTGGSIHASYAAANIHTDLGSDNAGGLVGRQAGGSITASYATGSVRGIDEVDNVGGLVGLQAGGAITASYATTAVDGGAGADSIGVLVGKQTNSPMVTESYGFGTLSSGDTVSTVGATPPASVTSAAGLTAANAGATWTGGANSTAGLWDFGTAAQAPAIAYADYDGPAVVDSGTMAVTSGGLYHCAAATAEPPDGAALVAECGDASTPLIPGQRPPALSAVSVTDVSMSLATVNLTSGTAGIAYVLALPADGTRTLTAAEVRARAVEPMAGDITATMAVVGDTAAAIPLAGLAGDTAYTAYIVVQDALMTDSVVSSADFMSVTDPVAAAAVDETSLTLTVTNALAGDVFAAVYLDASAPASVLAAELVAATVGTGPANPKAVATGPILAGVATGFDITGLEPGTEYTAFAVVRHGDGTFSEVFELVSSVATVTALQFADPDRAGMALTSPDVVYLVAGTEYVADSPTSPEVLGPSFALLGEATLPAGDEGCHVVSIDGEDVEPTQTEGLPEGISLLGGDGSDARCYFAGTPAESMPAGAVSYGIVATTAGGRMTDPLEIPLKIVADAGEPDFPAVFTPVFEQGEDYLIGLVNYGAPPGPGTAVECELTDASTDLPDGLSVRLATAGDAFVSAAAEGGRIYAGDTCVIAGTVAPAAALTPEAASGRSDLSIILKGAASLRVPYRVIAAQVSPPAPAIAVPTQTAGGGARLRTYFSREFGFIAGRSSVSGSSRFYANTSIRLSHSGGGSISSCELPEGSDPLPYPFALLVTSANTACGVFPLRDSADDDPWEEVGPRDISIIARNSAGGTAFGTLRIETIITSNFQQDVSLAAPTGVGAIAQASPVGTVFPLINSGGKLSGTLRGPPCKRVSGTLPDGLDVRMATAADAATTDRLDEGETCVVAVIGTLTETAASNITVQYPRNNSVSFENVTFMVGVAAPL